jgi:glycosyltransferase involved in cell wall biosynthesis
MAMTTVPHVKLLHHTFRRAGGMERYALVLCEALRELGCQVTVHARQGDSELARSLGVELKLVPTANRPRKLKDWRFFRAMERENRNVGPSEVEITLSRVRARDVVICGGTHRGYLRQARKFTGPFDLLQIWMERQAYASARTVISHSEMCTRELREFYGLPLGKILMLYPPVEARFKPAPAPARKELRHRFGFPEDKVVLLFPSMGHRRKGLRPIVRALEAFGDRVLLAVAGKPSGTTQPYVRAVGYVDDMVPLYQAADFTILGSTYEPFGLVGPESVSCGTRLVFEKRIGCLSAIDPAQVIPFSVWEQESIAAGVAQALTQAGRGEHRVPAGVNGLRYQPDPVRHAQVLLRALTCAA